MFGCSTDETTCSQDFLASHPRYLVRQRHAPHHHHIHTRAVGPDRQITVARTQERKSPVGDSSLSSYAVSDSEAAVRVRRLQRPIRIYPGNAMCSHRVLHLRITTITWSAKWRQLLSRRRSGRATWAQRRAPSRRGPRHKSTRTLPLIEESRGTGVRSPAYLAAYLAASAVTLSVFGVHIHGPHPRPRARPQAIAERGPPPGHDMWQAIRVRFGARVGAERCPPPRYGGRRVTLTLGQWWNDRSQSALRIQQVYRGYRGDKCALNASESLTLTLTLITAIHLTPAP